MRPIAEGDLFDDGAGQIVMRLGDQYLPLQVDHDDPRTPDRDWARLDHYDMPFRYTEEP